MNTKTNTNTNTNIEYKYEYKNTWLTTQQNSIQFNSIASLCCAELWCDPAVEEILK